MIPLWLSENLLKVSDRIRPLSIEYAFLGGSIVPLLLDDPDLSPIRPTNDVDVVILLVHQTRMAAIEAKLRSAGFAHDVTQGAPMCRWRLDDIIVDIMPDKGAEFMGLSSRWFSDALKSATLKSIPGGEVPVISAATFVATKLVAYADRGKGDYYHHDLEDVISVVDGRSSLSQELKSSPPALRGFVADQIRQLIDDPDFLRHLPGHLPSDDVSQSRLPFLRERLQQIAGLSDSI